MKLLFLIALSLASVVVVTATDQYLFCTCYTFPATKAFAGDSIYNPYNTAVPQNWVRCNFHAHVRCWNGLTNGSGTVADANRIYSSLHYGVHAISNYQCIDTCYHTSFCYVSSYEHGYNIRKNHQLVLGADKVCWKDYLLPQTINNKQDILNRLSADSNALVIINHPLVRDGYSSYDFQHLANYTCLDVLSPSCISTSFWDAALSAGKPIFITGNDDTHNIYDSNRVGSMCTWINMTTINKANTLHALKTGNSYGMIVGKEVTVKMRQGKSIILPLLKNCILIGTTIHVKFSQPAEEIIITGQNGRILNRTYGIDSIAYTLGRQESYARAVAIFKDGSKIFLNPVFRYQRYALAQFPVVVNTTKTLILRIAGVLVLLLWFSKIAQLIPPKRDFKKRFLPYHVNLEYGLN